MRILNFSIEFLEPIFSGNGALTRMQMEELLRQGHELLIFCGNELNQMKPEPIKKNLTVISIALTSQKVLGAEADFLGFSHGILQHMNKIREFSPELILVDDWHAASAVIALKFMLKIPVIYQYFRIFCLYPKFIPDPYKYQIVRKLEHDLAQTADLNIHLIKYTANWVKVQFHK